MFEQCTETVSILYAIIFGAGDACINIGIGSLLGAFAAFMGIVIVLQYVARRLWNNTKPSRRTTPERRIGTIYDQTPDDDDKFKDSAVWSSKR